MIETANETFPVPTSSRTLDTYGNVIRGKMKVDIVRMAFIMKLSFNDVFFNIYLPARSQYARHPVL